MKERLEAEAKIRKGRALENGDLQNAHDHASERRGEPELLVVTATAVETDYQRYVACGEMVVAFVFSSSSSLTMTVLSWKKRYAGT